MSTMLSDARHHVEKIQYYHLHAGSTGYSQARYHQLQLEEILNRALHSKCSMGTVYAIQKIIEDVQPLMDIMLQRQEEHSGH